MPGSSSDFHSEEDFPEVKTVFQVNFFHRNIISNFADRIRPLFKLFLYFQINVHHACYVGYIPGPHKSNQL